MTETNMLNIENNEHLIDDGLKTWYTDWLIDRFIDLQTVLELDVAYWRDIEKYWKYGSQKGHALDGCPDQICATKL